MEKSFLLCQRELISLNPFASIICAIGVYLLAPLSLAQKTRQAISAGRLTSGEFVIQPDQSEEKPAISRRCNIRRHSFARPSVRVLQRNARAVQQVKLAGGCHRGR